MVTFGRFRLGHWYERSTEYVRVEPGDRNWGYQSLLQLREIPDGLGSMRRVLTERGLDNVFRLTDWEVLELMAKQLTSGEICLFEEVHLTTNQLWEGASATNAAKEFLEELKDGNQEPPTVVWGRPQFRSDFDPQKNQIILDQHFKKGDTTELSDNELKQLVAVELGRAADTIWLRKFIPKAIQNVLTREQFVAEVDKRGFESRMKVIRSYRDGEFCKPTGTQDCMPLFEDAAMSIEYYVREQGGQARHFSYGTIWDQQCRPRYEQKQREKREKELAKQKEKEKEKEK